MEITEKNLEIVAKNHFLLVTPLTRAGTGKTVIYAFDYKRFCKENLQNKNRILFVSRREEILKQSVECFRSVLKDANFGDLFVGE